MLWKIVHQKPLSLRSNKIQFEALQYSGLLSASTQYESLEILTVKKRQGFCFFKIPVQVTYNLNRFPFILLLSIFKNVHPSANNNFPVLHLILWELPCADHCLCSHNPHTDIQRGRTGVC